MQNSELAVFFARTITIKRSVRSLVSIQLLSFSTSSASSPKISAAMLAEFHVRPSLIKRTPTPAEPQLRNSKDPPPAGQCASELVVWPRPAARRAGLPKSAARSRHWRTRGARESDCILAANAEHDRTRQTERQTVEGNANNMDVQSEGGAGFGLWFACAQRGRVPGSIPGDISRLDVAPLTTAVPGCGPVARTSPVRGPAEA